MAISQKDSKAAVTKKTAAPAKQKRRVNLKQAVRALVAELKKVTWPAKGDLVNTTGIVIVFIVAISALVGLLDLGASKLLQLITSIGQ